MHTQPIFNLPTSTNDIMSNNNRIAAALADLESQVVPNYFTTAKKHEVVRTTLIRRYCQNRLKLQSHYRIPTSAQYRPRENVTRSHSAVDDLWYISDTNVSQELCGRDNWELPWKKPDYAIHTSLSTSIDVVFTQ